MRAHPRGMICPSSASRSLREERAQGRPGAGWHPQNPCAERMHTQCTGETQGSRDQAFPARWFDGLCRALPGAEFLLASLAFAKITPPRRLTLVTPSRGLDRSNDGQDHTVSPYAGFLALPKGSLARGLCKTLSAVRLRKCRHAREVHLALHATSPPSTPPAPTATPSPRSKRRTTLWWAGMGETYDISEFR